jgi:hypothetical protein
MYNRCDVSVMSSRLTLFLCMLCGSNSVRLRLWIQERIMPMMFADKEKARVWRKYLALPTQCVLYNKDEAEFGLAVRRKLHDGCTMQVARFKPLKKVYGTAARVPGTTEMRRCRFHASKPQKKQSARHEEAWSAIPETPPRPQLPLMEAALVESSGSECHATTVTLPGSPARRDPYMAVCPAPPTCYAPSMAVCPGCSTGKPCPNYPPPRCYAPAPRYMPVTPPVSPRSLLLAIPPMCLTRRPAQDPPTIPTLRERYRELIALDSDSDSPSVEIVPK